MVLYHAATEPVEIAAPPERVREVFLDFANMSQCHTKHFKKIGLPAGKEGKDLKEGDNLTVEVGGMSFSAVVAQNTPEKFEWKGGLKYVLIGDHSFEFQPSKITPGHTTFVQYEDFTGLVTSVFNFSSKPKQAGPGFGIFNNDLKRKCEESSS